MFINNNPPHLRSIFLQERAGAQGDACTSGTAWYVCKSNDFTGCCSIDPCDLSTCPDSNTNVNGGVTSSTTSKTPVQITVLPSTTADDDGGAASSTSIAGQGSTLINTRSTTTAIKPQSPITTTKTATSKSGNAVSATSTKDLPLSTSPTSNAADTATTSPSELHSPTALTSTPTTSTSSTPTSSSSSSSPIHKTAIIASTVSIGSLIFLILLLLFYLRRRRANQQKKWLNESRGTISPYQIDHGHGDRNRGMNGDGVGDVDEVRDEEAKELDTPTDTTNSGSFQSRTGVEASVPSTDGVGEEGVPISFWSRLKSSSSSRRGNPGSASDIGVNEMNEKSSNEINHPSCLRPDFNAQDSQDSQLQNSNPGYRSAANGNARTQNGKENSRSNYSPDLIPHLDSTPIIPQNELEAFSSLPPTHHTPPTEKQPTAELSASSPSPSTLSSLNTTNPKRNLSPSPKTPTPTPTSLKKPTSTSETPSPSPSPSPPRSQNTFGSPRHEKKKSLSNNKVTRDEVEKNGKGGMKENGMMMRSNLNGFGYGYGYRNGNGRDGVDGEGREGECDVGDVTSWQEFDPKPRSWGRFEKQGESGCGSGSGTLMGGSGGVSGDSGGSVKVSERRGEGIGQQVSPMIAGGRWSGRSEVSPQISPEIGVGVGNGGWKGEKVERIDA